MVDRTLEESFVTEKALLASDTALTVGSLFPGLSLPLADIFALSELRK